MNLLAPLLTALLVTTAHAFTVPANDGFVTDTRGVLSADQDVQLEQMLEAYRQETTNEIAVLIVGSMDGDDIIEAGVETGRKWGVGTEENDNGIVMLIAIDDREMAIVTGYGLEGAVPDLVASGIIETDMRPAFREGDYYAGIVAGIDALQKHIGGEYTAERYEENDLSGLVEFFIFLGFILFQVVGAFLARTKSWWMGGVLGGVFGIILTLIFSWWLSIPLLILLGLVFDYIVSRIGSTGRRGRNFWTGGGGWGGGSGGGGFGGFSGGSFGGGGARGKW